MPEDSAYEAVVLKYLGELTGRAGEYDEAKALLDRSRSIASRLGLWLVLGALCRSTGEVEMAFGNLAEAETELREGVRIYERIRDPAHGTNLASLLATALALQGRVEEAGRFAELGDRWLSPDDVDGVVVLYCAQAEVALAGGHAEVAEERARAAVTAIDGTGYLNHRAGARWVWGERSSRRAVMPTREQRLKRPSPWPSARATVSSTASSRPARGRLTRADGPCRQAVLAETSGRRPDRHRQLGRRDARGHHPARPGGRRPASGRERLSPPDNPGLTPRPAGRSMEARPTNFGSRARYTESPSSGPGVTGLDGGLSSCSRSTLAAEPTRR